VGLLSFIILGLLAMFNQTQRAFRTSMTQSDVLEAGRSTMDLLVRELEQITPSQRPNLLLGAGKVFYTTNFFVELSPGFLPALGPLVQELPGNALARTNLVQRFFFLSKYNQDWIGTGYQVWPDDPTGCVGTLYRYSATNIPRVAPIDLSGAFLFAGSFATPPTNVSRVADGLVHLRVRAYDDKGRMLTNSSAFLNLTNRYPVNTWVYANGLDSDQIACYSVSNAVPAYVEIEMGILEPQILQRYRAIGNGSALLQVAQRQYLSNHVAQVHIFRQRVPVRNFDSSVYQ
jgi:hypothetical protein